MKKIKIFKPNHPAFFGSYGLAGLLCAAMLFQNILSPIQFGACIFFMTAVSMVHASLFRLEVNDKQLIGPGRVSPMVRVPISWKEADVLRQKKNGLRYLIIRQKNSSRSIRLPEMNFAKTTLQELYGLLERHALVSA